MFDTPGLARDSPSKFIARDEIDFLKRQSSKRQRSGTCPAVIALHHRPFSAVVFVV